MTDYVLEVPNEEEKDFSKLIKCGCSWCFKQACGGLWIVSSSYWWSALKFKLAFEKILLDEGVLP